MSVASIPGLRGDCPCCGGRAVESVYETRQIPVHSTLLFSTRDEAVTFAKGDLVLGCCSTCGFLFNRAYTDEHIEYSSRYEETQGFSRTFVEFHKDLSTRLIERFGLRGKRILEIGCGKGEFLNLLCGMGGNTGIGFDPAYVPERDTGGLGDRVTFVRELYSEAYAHERADFVCCKMTLEHIADPLRFVSMVRRAQDRSPDTVVFFQVPDMSRILRERAFWDVYYEHCSYFTAGSLRALFARSGFAVDDVWGEYGNQVTMIAARPGSSASVPVYDHVPATLALTRSFAADVNRTIEEWRVRLREYQARGRSIVIWGAGSKGVAFLTKIGSDIEIQYAVDVNPYKHGTYLAGTGQEIVGPAFLKDYTPGLVVVMNPVYMNEIAEDLRRHGVDAELLALT